MIQQKPRPLLRSSRYRLSGDRRWIGWLAGALAVVLLLGVGVAWAMGYFGRDARLVEIDKMREDLAAKGGQPFDQKNRELFGEIRKKMEELPQKLRDQARDEGRKAMVPVMEQGLKEFFAKSQAEQNVELDKWIARETAWDKQREEAAAKAQAAGSSSAAGGGDASKGGPQGAPPRGRGGGTDADRLKWRQEKMIDGHSPELRAQFTLFHQMMQQRRAQLGLPQSSGMGFGPPPGGPPPGPPPR